MHLVLIGCEYTGKTTMVKEIVEWIKRTMGDELGYHDHFTIPSCDLPVAEQEVMLKAGSILKEQFQRYVMEYHLHESFYHDPHHLLVGYHIEDAVYAPMYYGYGGKGQYSERTAYARSIEMGLLNRALDTTLVLLKATPDVIRQRMKQPPYTGEIKQGCQVPPELLDKTDVRLTRRVVKEEDIEVVLKRFDEEYAASLIRNKITLDTSRATVQETLAEFLKKFRPFMSDSDRLRILSSPLIK